MVNDLLEALAALMWEFQYKDRLNTDKGMVPYNGLGEKLKECPKERAARIVELLLEKGILQQ